MIPPIVGPMKYFPTDSGLKTSQLLGYNWYLCQNHWEAISKIDNIAGAAFQKGWVWSKNYHRAMIVFEAVPIVGHIIAALEVLLHRISLEPRFKKNGFEKWKAKLFQNPIFAIPAEQEVIAREWQAKFEEGNTSTYSAPKEIRTQPWFILMACRHDSAVLSNLDKNSPIYRDLALYTVTGRHLSAFRDVDSRLADDLEFQLDCLEVRGEYFYHVLPAYFDADYSNCIRAVARCGEIYQYLPEKWQRDELIILLAFTDLAEHGSSSRLMENARLYDSLPDDLKTDLPLLRKIVARNGLVLSRLEQMDGTWNDPEFVLTAIKNNHIAYRSASPEVLTQPGFFEKAYKANRRVIQFAPESYLADKKFVMDFLENTELTAADVSILHKLDQNLRKDREVTLMMVRRLPEFLGVLNENMLKDHEIVLTSLEKLKDKCYLNYIPRSLYGHKDIMRRMLQLDGLFLNCASEEFQDDKELALIAVKENRTAYKYVSKTLLNDPQVREAYLNGRQRIFREFD